MDMYDILLARNLGSGEGGTTNYNALSNKPEINGVPLQGDKSSDELKIAGKIVDGGTGEVFNDYSNNIASGTGSHAEGGSTTASGNYAHAEGGDTVASGNRSHAEGITTIASGNDSHAEGGSTAATGVASHAEGYRTTASAYYAHAEGGSTTASANFSHAEGNNTKASSIAQHVQGKYNIEDSAGKYAFIIGNGTSDDARSNALAVDWNGDIYPANYGKGVNLAQLDTDVAALRLALDAEVYGFKIDKQDSNPMSRVSYMYDAVGKYPAGMDFVNEVFRYGGWEDAWFVKGAKPCALRPDGTVAYYLNPDNYTEKEDGTASDISDTATELNFMVEFPTVWIKRWEDSRYQYVAISNKQIDDDFKAYAHDAGDGFINDYIYLPMFKGSTIDGKTRSIAGQIPSGGATWAANNTAVELNGAGWQMWDLSKHCLIVDLLTLISKTTNSQSAFGGGDGTTYDAEAADYGLLATGSDNLTTGQFWGVDDEAHHVKVFHIEDFWGNRADMCWGLIGVDLSVYIKPTRPYNTTPDSSYIDTGVVLPSTTTTFIKDMYLSTEGVFPKMGGASNSTYMCDYMRSNTGTILSVFGGNCGDSGGKIGYTCMHANYGVLYEAWWRGSSVCYNAPHST